jgi:omega-6 fatty acid desaturase (delta-12 desaturase)
VTEQLPPSFWRDRLAPYARPSTRSALLDLATSALPYVLLTAAMYALASVSVWLVLLLAIPAGGFLVRTFIVFHDCTHSSFLANRRANNWVGIGAGLLVYTPFHSWRHEHAVHHATAGDLDSRGMGDVDTLTVAEYRSRPWLARIGYRLIRSPFVMLGLGPIWALMIEPRLVPGWARARFWRQILRSSQPMWR